MLAHGARDESMLPGGQTSLQVAIEKNYDTIAVALLAAGAPTDTVDAQGRFALGLAASRASADMTSRLLEHHADPNVRGAGGRTALMIAAESGAAESIRSLLEHGAYATLADERGRTALWYASGSTDSHDVNLLLTALKPVPAPEKFAADSSGVTPLHRAVSAHSAESVDALLKNGHEPERRVEFRVYASASCGDRRRYRVGYAADGGRCPPRQPRFPRQYAAVARRERRSFRNGEVPAPAGR